MIKFHLRKTDGKLGYYRELWGLIAPTEKLFLGGEKSASFSRGSFLILPESEVFQGVFIACHSRERREEIKNLISGDSDFRSILTRLFCRDSSQITVGREIHVGGPLLLKRVTVLRFFPVPDEDISPWEKDLQIVAQKLRLQA